MTYKIDYKDMWGEQKDWLEIGIQYLKKKIMEESDDKEILKLKGKLEGMKVSLQHMKDSERMHLK